MPVWKRCFGAILFVAGGGAAAAWGIHGVVVWIGALRAGEQMIETDNFILGLPLIGCGLCAIGPEFVFPRLLAAWSDRIKTRVAGAVLGSILAGIVLVFLGQLIITITMETGGYRACDVQGRGRVTEVTWARAGAVCRSKDPGR